MAFIRIGNFELPPCSRGVTIEIATVVNAGRNVNGQVIGQKIGRDLYKINNLEWIGLTQEQWQQILTAIEPFYINATFPDPKTGKLVTVPCYVSDRVAEPYWVDDAGNPTMYRKCSFNLIDTGW